MKQPDWSKAPESHPIWIVDIGTNKGCWHRDAGDRYVDMTGSYWPKSSSGYQVVNPDSREDEVSRVALIGLMSDTPRMMAEKLYDAGYRKQVGK